MRALRARAVALVVILATLPAHDAAASVTVFFNPDQIQRVVVVR